MKRKRGHKKGKKGSTVAGKCEVMSNVVSLTNTEDNSNNIDEDGNDEYDSTMEVDTPTSTGTDHRLNVASIKHDGSMAKGKPVGYMKVKLKTPKMLESSHSDTDKSSSQMGIERQGGNGDRMEDSAISLAEMKMGILGNALKKTGSIRIKSSKALGSSSASKTGETSYQKGPKTPNVDHQYNKEELDAALMVIQKVMKMDASEPFNAPVNPEALGIPDYFDVIDTPMDFGTICNNLENGVKYMNSEDVFNDVQYIWENCNKYNNKGDYILDLMRRVKKNFMKYWTAAGLYNDQPRGNSGPEIIQVEDVSPSSQGKVQAKGGQTKTKSGKRHGRRHKNDCKCAICVLKRNKREREESARMAKGQFGIVDAQESKQEESSAVESPGGEDSSSNMGESQELDADAELEGQRDDVKVESTEQQYSHMEEKLGEEEEEEEEDEEEEEEEEEEQDESEIETQKKGEGEAPEQPHLGERIGEQTNRQSGPAIAEKSHAAVQTYTRRNAEENAASQQQLHKIRRLQDWEEKAKMYERFENPMLLSLCGVLFPENCQSVWSGPHSLSKRQNLAASASSNSIHAAVSSFMK